MFSWVDKSTVIKLFGVLQGLFLVAILLMLYLRWRTERNRPNDEVRFDNLDDSLKASRGIQKAKGFKPYQEAKVMPEISSAFPNWTENTSSYDILDLHPSSSKEEVETAYKKLLKKYHPDRFSSWGDGYQRRAHYIILRIQKARDEILKTMK